MGFFLSLLDPILTTFVQHFDTFSLTRADYNNKYIITDDLIQIINLSGKANIDRSQLFKDTGIIVREMPLTEEGNDMGYQKILDAVRHLLYWDNLGKRSLVCCDFGVNRSRTVVEAFHYARMGYHFEDEYKGCVNHLIYNCQAGHLPPLSEVESELKSLGEAYN